MKAKRDGIVEVSGHVYKLRYVKGLKNPDNDGPAWGIHKPDTKEILIEADLTDEFSDTVLYHEIQHAVLEHAGHGNIDCLEGVCDATAYGWPTVKINGKRLLR